MSQQQDWTEQAGELAVDSRPYINGRHCDANASAVFQGTNPVDRSAGFSSADCNAQDVDAAVSAARAAFLGGWGEMAPGQRKSILLALAGLVDANAERLGLCDSLDVGKPVMAAQGEAHAAAGFIRYYAESIDKVYSGHSVPTGKGDEAVNVSCASSASQSKALHTV